VADLGKFWLPAYIISFFSFATYNMGDMVALEYSECLCGRKEPLLKLVGQETDFLELNGKKIESSVLTVLISKFDIGQYQIIQETGGLHHLEDCEG